MVYEVVVIGGGPAGMDAARRAAVLGANTALVTKDYLGGMAANDGPVPVCTLAHAARLVREAKQLDRYGIAATRPVVDYPRLLDRVQEVVKEVHVALDARGELESLGVSVFEGTGFCGFKNEHTIETESDLRLEAQKFIICSFPTYLGIVGWAAYDIVEQLGLHETLPRWQPHRILV